MTNQNPAILTIFSLRFHISREFYLQVAGLQAVTSLYQLWNHTLKVMLYLTTKSLSTFFDTLINTWARLVISAYANFIFW